MATFTPPANATEVPGFDADASPMAKTMFRYHGGRPRARNFYIVGSTFTEVDPSASYNADGSMNQDALQRTTRFFQSGTGPFTVTSAEAALITTAGYGAYLS